MFSRLSRAIALRSSVTATPVISQCRTIVVKRTYDPPLVEGKNVTQEMIDRSVPDDLLYMRYEVLEEESEIEDTVPPIKIILTKAIEGNF